MFKNSILTSIALLFVVSGCSKSPEPYNGVAPAKNKIQEQNIPTFQKPIDVIMVGSLSEKSVSTDLISASIDGEEKLDALKTFNSRLPIIYSVGVAGITLKTTLQEASLILTPPPFGVNSDFTALYDEGIYVRWRKDDPQTPENILILESYLGEIQVPAPHKPIKMKHSFADDYDEDTLKGAQDIARDYYRIFENTEADYDCLAARTCQVIYGDSTQKDFYVLIPGRMIWMISKDRFILFRMVIEKPRPAGVLDTSLDLLKQQFVVSENEAITLGDTFASIEKMQTQFAEKNNIVVQSDPIMRVDTLAREYDGVTLEYRRTQFGRKDDVPKPTDLLQSLLVVAPFEQAILLGGKVVLVTETADSVSVSLAEPEKAGEQIGATETSITSPLVLSMGLKKENVKLFAQAFADLLKAEMQSLYPQAKFFSRVTGSYQRQTFKNYLVSVAAFDVAKDDGLFIQYSIGEEQGNLYAFYVTKLGGLYNLADRQIFDASDKGVLKGFGQVPKKDFKGNIIKDASGKTVFVPGKMDRYTQLAGFTIGEVVKIKNWDLGRNEADLEYTDRSNKALLMRVPYFDVDSGFYTFSTEIPSNQNQATVFVGNVGATLGLKKVSTLLEEADGLRVYQIMNISTSFLASDIQEVCGSSALKISLDLSVEQFQKIIQSTPNCKPFEYYQTDGTRALQFVFFPNERIRFNFSEDALDSVTIYAREDEVK